MGKEQVLAYLDSIEVKYDAFDHEAVYTMQDCNEVDSKAGLDIVHCKNLFLCNRQQTDFYLLLIRWDKKFKTADVSKQLEVSRLSFGSDERLMEMMGIEPGGVSPMGLINDSEKKIRLIVDNDLKDANKMCFHPNVNTSSIVMSGNDFYGKFLDSTGHKLTYVEINTLL